MSVADYEKLADHLFWLLVWGGLFFWMIGAFDRD